MDSELLEQLEALHSSAYCWALACCRRNAHEAEDVLQTVYVKVLEGKARFRGESSLKTWLFSLVRITAAERRRRYRRQFEKLLNLVEQPRDSEALLDEQLVVDERRRALLRALESLPARQYEVLYLVFYHDLTIQEASDVMGVSVGSARTHYERGKKRLRRLLAERESSHVSDWSSQRYSEEVSKP